MVSIQNTNFFLKLNPTFETSVAKIPKYIQLKFTINVNNKKWLFYYKKNII